MALISDAGTPLVSDPGYKLVRAVLDAEAQVCGAAGSVGRVVRDRGCRVCRPISFILRVSCHRGRASGWRGLAEVGETCRRRWCCSRRRTDWLRHLPTLWRFSGPERQVVVARELTKRFEEVRRGTAGEIAAWAREAALRGEIVLADRAGSQTEVGEDDIRAALAADGDERTGLKEASRIVAGKLGVARSPGLRDRPRLKARQP